MPKRARAHGCRYDGLGRVIPKTCPDEQKIRIPEHRRCRPPKRELRTVELPHASTPRTVRAVASEADRIVREAKVEAKAVEKAAREEVADAQRIVREAEAQARKVRTVRYQKLTPAELDRAADVLTNDSYTGSRARTPKVREERLPSQRSFYKDPERRERAMKLAPRNYPSKAQMEARRARAERRAATPAREVSREEAAKALRTATREADSPHMTLVRAFRGKVENVDLETVGKMFPVNPCNGKTYADFARDDSGLQRKLWRNQLFECSRKKVEGLGRLSPKEAAKLKTKLLGKRNVTAEPPSIDDIDPWGVDRDPCTGISYKSFNSKTTRKDAYWTGKRGEHGPSRKKTNASHAVLKRLAWQERLHSCAMEVWVNRARVSKNAKVREAAAQFARHEEIDPMEFSDEFSGLGRTRAKGVKRCYKAPKKLSNGCSEKSYRDNLRHLNCVAKKHPGQAKAIAAAVLKKGCKVPKTKVQTITKIVAAGKRKKARKAAKR